MKKSVIGIVLAIVAAVFIAACGSKTESGAKLPTGKTIKTVPVANLTATLSNNSGQLKQGNQEFIATFTDSSGKPVDVGAVSLNFHMGQMGTMAAMNDQTSFTTTETPGVYRGRATIETAGQWQAQLAY